MKKLAIISIVMSLSITAHAGAVASTVGCAAIVTSPIGIQAVGLVKAAQAAGMVTDEEDCLSHTVDAAAVTAFFAGGNPVVGALISGVFVKCACKVVF